MIQEFKRIIQARSIILYLVIQDLKSMHRNKLLGNIWALLDPLCMMVVLYFVFSYIRHATPVFALYLLSGLFTWEFFNRSVLSSTLTLRKRQSMIHKFPIPLGVFPIAIILEKIYDFAWSLGAYYCMYLLIKYYYEPFLATDSAICLIPVWLFFFVLFTLGLSFIVSHIGVYFVDMQDIVAILMRMGYFMNPVFMDMRYIPADLQRTYFFLNPLAGFLIYIRYLVPGSNMIARYQIPIDHYEYYLAMVSVLTFLIGFYIFMRGSRHVSKYV